MHSNMEIIPNSLGSLKVLQKNNKKVEITSINLPSTPKINYDVLKNTSRLANNQRNFRLSSGLPPVEVDKNASYLHSPSRVTEPEIENEDPFLANDSAGVSPDDGLNIPNDGLIIPNSTYTKPNFSETQLQEINKTVFKNEGFKENQVEIINLVLKNKHVIACCPTGSGKSLIYQVAGYALPGITIVIMPIVALIKEQHNKLKSIGIEAYMFYEHKSHQERHDSLHYLITRSQVRFIFMTPEMLDTAVVTKLLKELNSRDLLNLLVIDEFHCVFSFNDFRPKFSKIGETISLYQNLRVLCLSGSIRNSDLLKITQSLRIGDPVIFKKSPTRSNLFYEVIAKDKKTYLQEISKMIKSRYKDQTGIIYCVTTNNCDSVKKSLTAEGISCDCYYGGEKITEDEKNQRRTLWLRGHIKVMISTSAFGMGIDNHAVRFVIHADMPQSMTEFYQESGRGGRDGQRSNVHLFYSINDRKKILNFIERCSTEESKKSYSENLYIMTEFCEETIKCRKKMISKFFGFKENPCKDMCDNCLNPNFKRMEPFKKDFYNEVKIILSLLTKKRDWTLVKLNNALTGKVSTQNNDLKLLEEFGKLSDLNCVPRLINKMLHLGLMREIVIKNMTWTTGYLKPVNEVPEKKLHVKIASWKYQISPGIIEVSDSDCELFEPVGDPDVIFIPDLPSKRTRENN